MSPISASDIPAASMMTVFWKLGVPRLLETSPNAFLLGQSAHPLTRNLITPYKLRRLGPGKRRFNTAYSTVRGSVETVSGVIVTRWRRLLGIHLLSMSFMCKLCAAAITLHINCNEADGFFDVAEDLHFEAVSQKAADASAISLQRDAV